MPLEVVMSKYYGESERLLGSVFSLANDLPDGGIIFLDEVYVFLFVPYNNLRIHKCNVSFCWVLYCEFLVILKFQLTSFHNSDIPVIGGLFCYCTRQ